MNFRFTFFFVIVFVFSRLLFGVNIGSDTAVERFTTPPTLNDGDRIATFAFLKAGFKLNGPSATGVFDSVFGVSGDIELSGGVLSLSSDLILKDIASIESLGNIVGNDHIVELTSSITTVSVGGSSNSDCPDIFFLDSELQSTTNVLSCDWSYDDAFVAIGMLSGGIRIYEFDGRNLILRASDTLSSASANDVNWHPTKHLLAVGITVSLTEDEVGIYDFNSTSWTLTATSGINTGVSTYAVQWHPDGDWLAVGKNNTAQEVSTHAVNSWGDITATPAGTYNAAANVNLRAMRFNSDGTYLAVGTGTQLLVLDFNSSTGALALDVSLAPGYSVLSVAWNEVATDFLAIGLTIYNVAGQSMRVYEHDSGASTLTLRASIDDGTSNDYVRSLDWREQSSFLVFGKDSDWLGTEFRTYCFNPTTYALTLVDEFEVAGYVRCVQWSHGGSYIARGDNTNNISIYVIRSSPQVTFCDINMFLNSDIFLQDYQITFTGQSLIDGRGHYLDLESPASIIVGRNSSLCLRDICITGLLNSNIYCTDNTSTLSVDNCQWVMDSDYTFGNGHLEVFNDFEVIGDGYNFIYATDQESIITSNAKFILDSNVTFSYAPLVANRDLINLYDDTSSIVLHGATLFSTTTGLRLTKGNLLIEKKSYLSCDGTVDTEAISFGDGASAANDLTIQFVGAANLEVLSGRILYDNLLG